MKGGREKGKKRGTLEATMHKNKTMRSDYLDTNILLWFLHSLDDLDCSTSLYFTFII